mmetsp:Transcript_20781/g.24568  ORF Transcript_20781/g.24568 Transcript_20781/m.24568 type:complete len:152 (+) Transcript_20781:113-568(+)|eukprot:CAMPEP_0114348192 /NCGR_PEP_ID=MMETSP0101-20121206/14514_1 /TAXON_ID=38822 ORGANISM="Pteridomonas danica, Strain PT" /NCGR_SAMPLE_ID=MMETSP0101 /ASSEMBLY_ACC=CAM_ASM_000211 /LENGTH=151 /DNA_ID=CAMNT_0001485975 /DNA_START=132 /DNA_END=587 /DNA_ORIENTATION=+
MADIDGNDSKSGSPTTGFKFDTGFKEVNKRWGMEWGKIAVTALHKDDPVSMRECLSTLSPDEVNTQIEKGLVGFGLRFKFVYDIPLKISSSMQLGDTLLDIAHRTNKSEELLTVLREFGMKAVNMKEQEDIYLEEMRKQARKAELQAEGRI